MAKLTLEAIVKKYKKHVEEVVTYVGMTYDPQLKKDAVAFAKQKRGNAALLTRALGLPDETYISDWKTGYHEKRKAKKAA